MPSFVKTILTSIVIVLWSLGGLLLLALAGRKPSFVHDEFPSAFFWAIYLAIALLMIIPLLGSLIASLNRKLAATLFLSAAPLAFTGLCLGSKRDVQYGTSWFAILGNCFLTTLLFCIIPGIFWLVTHHHGWPPLIARPSSLKRRMAFVLMTGFVVFFVAVGGSTLFVLRESTSGSMYRGWGPPIVKQEHPNEAVFVAQVIHIGNVYSYDPKYGGWALARVQERFWGLPWWNLRLVFLTDGIFENGEQYYFHGIRQNGLLTRFSPIIIFQRSSRSAPVRYATADLRVLHDGPPRMGVRIIGDVFRGREMAPGITVTVIGPAGVVTATSDQQGVFDVKDLPPGHYNIRIAATNDPGPSRFHPVDCDSANNAYANSSGVVQTGEVWGCSFSVP